MDQDLADLDREALIAQIKRLRAGIREHRDSTEHELCWHHPKLWGLLPEKSDPVPSVPAWPQFLRGCLQYRESLDRQLPNAPRTHAELGAAPSTNEASRIVDELTRAIDGDPWHGDAVASILRDVTATTARVKPDTAVHSIWEIVRHMAAWTGEAARRIDGHVPGQPQEGDWPAPSGGTEADWTRDVLALVETHRRLLQKIANLSDNTLHAPPVEHRDRPVGSGVSYYVLLHGLAQHHAYHAGQIALLKKIAWSV